MLCSLLALWLLGRFVVGRSTGAADFRVALKQYNDLRAQGDALMGRLGSSLGDEVGYVHIRDIGKEYVGVGDLRYPRDSIMTFG